MYKTVWNVCILILLVNFLCDQPSYCNQDNNGLVVSIPQGKIRGLDCISRNGTPYYGFLNIPYVYPPERFGPPSFQQPKSWDGIRDGTKFGPRCIQRDGVMNKIDGAEDCLTLNIYTPNISPDVPYAVLVYIHGGGYQWGAGHIHGGKYFLDQPVVLVTFNYRLGPMGFLSTGDSVVTGNMGMKDQVACLRWIQRNIKYFGGNENLVTIFGESAGAGAVSLHLLSPMSKGLFKHAISQSGSALNPWNCLKNPNMPTRELAEKLKCPVLNDSSEVVKCLKSKSVDEILHTTMQKWYIDPTVPFDPVVEKLLPGQTESEAFLPESPYDILSNRITDPDFEDNITLIIGFNEEEGIYLHTALILKDEKLVQDLNTRWNEVAPWSITYYENETISKKELNLISSKIRQFYLPNNQKVGESTRQPLTDLYSDRYFVHGIIWHAVMEARQKNAHVYPYIFTFNGSFSFLQQRGFDKGLGVTHKDDLQYLFDGIAPELNGMDKTMSETMIQLWTSFAYTGKPHLSSWTVSQEWKPISPEEANGETPLNLYNLGLTLKTIPSTFLQDRMNFWNTLMTEHETVNVPRKIKTLRVISHRPNEIKEEL